jgi:PAS domain S-box-containing protein
MPADKNRRVLVIDDNRAIHDDFRKILSPAPATAAALDAVETAVLGPSTETVQETQFEVDPAYQGQEGVLLVKKALEAERPYAMAFVDVRMPPGWDGVETTQKIWAIDPDIQIVLCTAYSDYSWDEMFEKLGHRDRLLILKKPFDAVEVFQLAHALTEKWWLHQQSRQKMEELENRVAERTNEILQERLLLRTLIDNLPDCIYAKDTAGRKTMANPADLKNLRCQTEAEAIGKSDFDLFPKEIAEQFWADDQVVLKGQPVLNREEHFFDEAGRKRWLLTSKLPLRDLTGKIVGLVGIGHDITERKQAEDTIARERQLLRTLIDRLPETFYIKDLESRFLVANEAQAEQCGKGTPSQVLGLSDADLFPAELAAEFRAEELKVFAGEPLIDHENTVIFPDGREHTVLTTKLPFRDSQGQICGLVGIGHDITERKRSEAALQENQRQLAEVNQMLQAVMDTIPVRIFWKNRDLVYMGCNRLFAEDAGRKSSEDLVGETDYDMSWRDRAEQYRQDDMEVMNSGNPKLNYEEPQTTPEGKQIWLRTSKVPLRDINNHTIGILGTYEVITERKRAEEALRYEQTLMTTLMDNVPAAIYFKDAASRFIRVNRAHSRKFGLSDPAQLAGKSDADFFSGEYAQQALADEQKIIRTGQPLLNVEEKESWLDGTVSWVLTTKLPLSDAAKRIIGTCGISFDITDRKRVEQALAERTEEVSQRNQELAGANATLQQQIAVRERIEQVLDRERLLLRTLIDNLPDYVYAQDAEGRFVVANLGMARQLGFSSPNEVVGKSNFDLFPHELAARYHLDEQEIIRTGKGLYNHEGLTVDASKKEKNRWVSTTKVPLRNDLGEITGFVSLGQDITERKRQEEVLQQSSRELQRRNDELARFTYTVSHDLKSPLVTIKAFLGYLEQDTLNQDAEAIKKDRQYIYTAVDKMTRLLDELLDLARVGRKMNPPEEVPLPVLVKDALDMVAGWIIQKGVEVVVTKEPIMLCGDRTRLVEVFQNLVDNAIKFMGEQPKPRVEIGVEKVGEENVFFVRDNGMGIDPRYLPKVFGLFEKYDPRTSGTGIGLALVKRIVEVHGGKIWVESAGIGKGATFRFTLAKTQPHPVQP